MTKIKTIKTNTIFLISILFILFSQSCKKYTLSSNDLEWQPYKVNDILVFESSNKEIDTVFITEIASYSNPEDNLAIVSDYHETLFVTGEVTLLKPKIDIFKKQYYRGQIKILSMHADKDNSIEFNFNKLSDSLVYARAEFTISDLKKYYNDTPKINLDKIKDIIIIPTKKTYSVDYDLINVHWNKKYGYVRYDFKDGSFWELREFIRDKKNILPR